MGGDFNSVTDLDLDRSHPPLPQAPTVKASKSRRDWQTAWGLLDSWRVHHGTSRDYSFFSVPHALHVRLDSLLCSPEVHSLVRHTEYLAKTITDHNPCLLILRWTKDRPAIPSWRLNPHLLEDPVFHEELRVTIDNDFTENAQSTASRSLEWDAFKVVVRGHCMSSTVGVRKLLRQDVDQAERHLREVEQLHHADPTARDELLTAREELATQMERLRSCDYREYLVRAQAERDKVGSLLAWLANPAPRGSPIVALRAPDDTLEYTQKGINNSFRIYYTALYAAQMDQCPIALEAFLRAAPLLVLDRDSREDLGREISTLEIRAVIKEMARNKTPGVDGLPVEFYLSYADLLVPQLQILYKEAWETGKLPSTTREAIIIPILKTGGDSEVRAAYRPLSMLTVDYKILSKILALRLLAHMERLIHPDQAGFIPKRNTAFNVRRFLRLLGEVRDMAPEAVALSVDIEKAFNSLEWPYLMGVLRAFGLGDGFVRWTTLLYNSATARVRTGRMISTAWDVGRGTRQGCSLSPLLFALAMEPLATHARAGTWFSGVSWRGEAQYISLYADDLLLFLANTREALRGAQTLLNTFGDLSGLRVNWSKTCLFPMTHGTATPELPEQLRWESHCLPYLGTVIYHSPADLLEGNVGRAIRALRGNMGFWQTLPLSVAGRIALLKMVALPRLLYYFRVLPLWVPGSIFRRLRSMMLDFIWGAGRRRVALNTLIRQREEGGMGAPDLEWYYLAAQLQWLTQAVAREFRGPEGPLGRIIPRHILSFITFCQRLRLSHLTIEERTLQLCWNRSCRRVGTSKPYAPEIPLGACTALPHGATGQR